MFFFVLRSAAVTDGGRSIEEASDRIECVRVVGYILVRIQTSVCAGRTHEHEEGRKERVAQRTTVAHRTQDTGTDLCLHSDNMEIVLRTLIGLFAWWQVSFELKYILVLVYCGMYEGIPTSLAVCLSIIFRGPCKPTDTSVK